MPCEYHYGCMWPSCFCNDGMCDEAAPVVEAKSLESLVQEAHDERYHEVKGG